MCGVLTGSLSNQSVCTREIIYSLTKGCTARYRKTTRRWWKMKDSEGVDDDRTGQRREREGEGRRTLLETECGWLMVKTQAGSDTKGRPRWM